MSRGGHQHVNVIGRHGSTDNHDFTRIAYLPNQIAGTLGDLNAQNLVTVFRDPYQVTLEVADRVPAMPVFGHSLILVESR